MKCAFTAERRFRWTCGGMRNCLRLSRLAFRRNRRLHPNSADGEPDSNPSQGTDRLLLLSGALRNYLGCSAGTDQTPARDTRTGVTDWIVVPTGPFEWQCNASRQVENFTDFGHFPFVHPGLLGDPSAAGRSRAHRAH